MTRRLLPGYLESRRKESAQLEAALAANDFDLLRRVGHNLKGSGGAYGLPPVSEFGAEIEEAALVQDAGRIRVAVAALASFLARVTLQP